MELGCGKGEYSVGLARVFPDRNFIGVDIKGHRIWKGATTAEEEKLGKRQGIDFSFFFSLTFFCEGRKRREGKTKGLAYILCVRLSSSSLGERTKEVGLM